MNPLLAIAAAKVGSKVLGSLAGNDAPQAPSAGDLKKAAFAQMLAKATNTPQFKHSQLLGKEGISNHSDAETTLNQMSQKILQSPEIAKELEGQRDAFELKFLPDGKVAIKKTDGTEKVFNLDGQLLETAKKAVAIMESVKIAFPNQAIASSKEPGGTLRMVPGARATLLA